MGRFRTPVISLGVQEMMMRRHFPGFKYSRENNIPTWRGTLQPSDASPIYSIKVVYRYNNQGSRSPNVWVISPAIKANAKHRYSNGSLCLYFPSDGSWTPNELISQTIIPWASLWLRFYEIWLETDCWYGPEAPHNGLK